MSGLSVLNNVGGEMRWINDRANETITLSQTEFRGSQTNEKVQYSLFWNQERTRVYI